MDLGGNTAVTNQSLAVGYDHTLSATSVLDFRIGYFRYKVDVFPNDYGTNPALDAGIPGMNFPNDPFTSGLPIGFINTGNSDNTPSNMSFGTGLGDRGGRCNCPLAEDESQYQFVTNFTKSMGSHTVKTGVDIRRAFNLRVPSDNHRSGEIDFNSERTQGAERAAASGSPPSCSGTCRAIAVTSAPAPTPASGSGAGSCTRRIPGGTGRSGRSTTASGSRTSCPRRSTSRATRATST